MNFIYYCKIDEPDNTELFDRIFWSLSDTDISGLSGLKKRADQWRSMTGKVLLYHILKENGLWHQDTFPQTGIDHLGRPFLTDLSCDFNISHAEDIVACALSVDGRIGCDVEKINPFRLFDCESVFNTNEWEHVIRHPEPLQEFYRYWTRKEAVLKAIGTGFLMDPAQIDVTADQLWFGQQRWHITDLKLEEEYAMAIVFNKPLSTIVRKVSMHSLLNFRQNKNPDFAVKPVLQTTS